MNKKIMVSLLKDYGLYKSRCVLLEKEIGAMSQPNNMESFSKDAAEKMKSELYELKHTIDKIETALELTGKHNERYKKIIESHFFYNVRIEDIADMTHLSRSRCYELCNEAVTYMCRILFGENDNLDSQQIPDIEKTIFGNPYATI